MQGGNALLYEAPRWVGNPLQMYVTSEAQFWQFVELFNGRSPCFTSHNGHPTATLVHHRYVPFDFDKKGEKIENTLNDALLLKDWAKSNGIETLHVFTGGNGFHSYLVFAARMVQADNGMKGAYKAIQQKAIEEAKLRTADRGIVGDIRRILRIVGCEYVSTKDGSKTGFFTTEIPTDMLERASMDEIREYSRTRRPLIVQPDPHESFRDAFDRLDLRTFSRSLVTIERATPTIAYKNSTPEFVKAKLPRPCIHQGIMAHNPSHVIRFEAARLLLQTGNSVEETTSFLMDVAEQAGWVDRNEERTRYHVDNIAGNHYSQTSCRKIRANGLCVGKACPMFTRAFPEEAV